MARIRYAGAPGNHEQGGQKGNRGDLKSPRRAITGDNGDMENGERRRRQARDT